MENPTVRLKTFNHTISNAVYLLLRVSMLLFGASAILSSRYKIATSALIDKLTSNLFKILVCVQRAPVSDSPEVTQYYKASPLLCPTFMALMV